ncbi:sensor histidine kinase [Halorientalis pallida]|uniref:histidine kinase n=1 Tax=Halorientalis pallida TaxID=2479928 RepID=A0A498KVV5_9EURY|nr:GAF domain-containing sensor histidine kinase [Halorientalis pallida]RXK49378.1 sensor histidine kinase [Halorientalis pallida]
MQQDAPFEAKAEQALALGESYLGVTYGRLTRIDPESEYWRIVVSTDSADDEYPPGLVLDLGMTYCRHTIGVADPVEVDDALASDWEDDPAFEHQGFRCYYGTTITVEDNLYGTVCFAAEEPRGESFSEDETLFAELVGRMLEHELEHRRTQRKVDRLDDFAGIVSHDLRNPLNVAQLNLESLRADVDDERLTRADDALDRMAGLIDDVLTVARQGQHVTETETVALSTLADDCWTMVGTGDASLVVEDDLRFRADPDRLQRLFENLYRNAVEQGESDVTVRVGTVADDGFYVEDDGPGFPPDERERVFEAGFSTTDGGSGLGLAIVESIVDAHGWSSELSESAEDGPANGAGDDSVDDRQSFRGARFEITGVVVDQTAERDPDESREGG